MTEKSSKIKVLVVDDSAVMRQVLSQLFNSSPLLEVVGFAKDGREALEKTRDLQPDVITLDVEMPIMTGMEALPGLVGIFHKPVVMVSSLTQEGAEQTFQALELGAVDFVPKPIQNTIGGLKEVSEEIITKVVNAAKSQIRIVSGSAGKTAIIKPPAQAITPAAAKPATTEKPPIARPPAEKLPRKVVVIGISTGGPQALSETLIHVKPPIPPTLIVQHMPGKFTNAFASRLNNHSQVHVKEAVDGERLQNDTIYIAPGGRHMRVVGKSPASAAIEINDDPPMTGHKPSADYLFESVLPIFGSAVVGIIMTGMGRDGATGMVAIRKAGGATYGQDEATSTVYGMNKAAFQEGGVQTQFPLEQLPAIITKSWNHG